MLSNQSLERLHDYFLLTIVYVVKGGPSVFQLINKGIQNQRVEEQMLFRAAQKKAFTKYIF